MVRGKNRNGTGEYWVIKLRERKSFEVGTSRFPGKYRRRPKGCWMESVSDFLDGREVLIGFGLAVVIAASCFMIGFLIS